MIDDHTFGAKKSESKSGFSRWYERNRPAVIATLWLWLVFLILALITLFTGWASLLVTMLIQTILSLGAGMLAANLFQKKPIENSSAARQGILAGIYLPLTTGIVISIVGLWIGVGSLGTLVPLMLPFCVALPAAVILDGFCGLIGARLWQWVAERRTGQIK